ncbi:hypothetical protein [Capillimicrobium parvum]|uniref:Uncharacterized protein n=1 Tax=Capillimicrobium parvum TaxID=2884022 RepID=A0A9E6XYU7_9ACTN|nr:hypothetical protein [Capillimicrobium parvum]UGS36820.1 hypothetical protein DSM104329_03231 [Capillimicrobium parvum]
MSLRHLTLILFVLTLALMLPFELTITRLLGVASMVAFVVVGLFWIATPSNLERLDEDAPAGDAGDAGDQPPAPGVTR